MSKPKVLVTGATGFIGNYVVKEILKYNVDVVATSRMNKDDISLEWMDRVSFVSCDIHDQTNDFYTMFEKPDVMIHLSWSGLPNYRELHHIESNFFNQYHFIKSMIKSGLKDLVISGTCFEYGFQSGCLAENHETKPNTSYSLAKDTLRKFIEELNKNYDFSFKWIRLFYLYGEGQAKTSILGQLRNALDSNEKVFNMSGGEQLRDYLPVEKVAEYIVKISLQNKFLGVVNCCSGKPISIRKLVENYLEAENASIQLNLGYYSYPDYEPMSFWGNSEKLKKILACYE